MKARTREDLRRARVIRELRIVLFVGILFTLVVVVGRMTTNGIVETESRRASLSYRKSTSRPIVVDTLPDGVICARSSTRADAGIHCKW